MLIKQLPGPKNNVNQISAVVIDSDAMVIDSGGHLSDQNVIFVESGSVPFSVSDNQQVLSFAFSVQYPNAYFSCPAVLN